MRAPHVTDPIDLRPAFKAAVLVAASAASIPSAPLEVESTTSDAAVHDQSTADPVPGADVKKVNATGVRDLNEYSRRVDQWLDHAGDVTRLVTPEQVAAAFKKDNVLIAWTDLQGEVEIEMIYLSPEQYSRVGKLVGTLKDEEIAKFVGIPTERLKEFFMSYSGLDEKEVVEYWDRCKVVIGSALLMKHNRGYSDWLRRVGDENHPFFARVDKEQAPRGVSWTHVPGVDGDIPFNKSYTNMLPTAFDRWFYIKNDAAHPWDKREMRTEIDIREHKSRLAIVFALVKQWSLQVARPADKDKDYFFPTEKEMPFDGIPITTKAATTTTDQWDISKETAWILNDVVEDPNKIRPAYNKVSALKFLRAAPLWQPTMYSNEEADAQVIQRLVK